MLHQSRLIASSSKPKDSDKRQKPRPGGNPQGFTQGPSPEASLQGRIADSEKEVALQLRTHLIHSVHWTVRVGTGTRSWGSHKNVTMVVHVGVGAEVQSRPERPQNFDKFEPPILDRNDEAASERSAGA